MTRTGLFADSRKSILQPTRITGISRPTNVATSGAHFTLTFSSESGESIEKAIKTTCDLE